MRKKVLRLFAVLLVITLSLAPVTIYANTEKNEKTQMVVLKITDPETREEWCWEIPASVKYTYDRNDNKVISAEVQLDITRYLARSFGPQTNGGSFLQDNITIVTGLTYSVDYSANKTRIHKVFGSSYPSGLYYATNKVVYWRNSGGYPGGTFYPTPNEWNVDVDSTPAYYTSDLAPYSLLDCQVHVVGMNAYRNISVQFMLIL